MLEKCWILDGGSGMSESPVCGRGHLYKIGAGFRWFAWRVGKHYDGVWRMRYLVGYFLILVSEQFVHFW